MKKQKSNPGASRPGNPWDRYAGARRWMEAAILLALVGVALYFIVFLPLFG